MRAFIAQKVDVIVIFADAGPALLPTVKEASEAGILVVLHNGTYVGGKPGKDFVTAIAENICGLGTEFVKIVAGTIEEGPDDHRRARWHARATALSAGWQKCSEEEIAKHKNLKLLGKADTNWTQEGSFKAMSGFLAQHGSVDARSVRIRRRLPRRRARLRSGQQEARRDRHVAHRRNGSHLRLGKSQ